MLIHDKHYRSIWPNVEGGKTVSVSIVDQTQLPHQFSIAVINHLDEMVHAIKTMQVRGAPLIGASAAYGLALAMLTNTTDTHMHYAIEKLTKSRPTAVNLAWAMTRMREKLMTVNGADRLTLAWQEAANICDEDVELNRNIGIHGLALIQQQAQALKSEKRRINILTHCNAGWLATVDIGTALSPIYTAHDAGIDVHVWVDETRPRNQGASLTAWELGQHGVPHTVICDNAGGHLMQHGEVDMVIVGADRVTATGDVCNKIGTYLKALAAFDNNVPFYVAVPSPTIDWAIRDGVKDIPIELRDADEVAYMHGIGENGKVTTVRIVPKFSPVANPAFDVTPVRLVTGIITEKGVFAPSDLQQ